MEVGGRFWPARGATEKSSKRGCRAHGKHTDGDEQATTELTVVELVSTLQAPMSDASDPERDSPAHQYLVPRVSVPEDVLVGIRSPEEVLALALAVFRETGQVLAVCAFSHLDDRGDGRMRLPRGQAVCAAHLHHISSFMLGLARLVDVRGAQEVGHVLSRCIFEAVVNVRFLMRKGDPALFERFMRSGLGPERELYELIMRNIAARGGSVQQIETRMLTSIRSVCQESGLRIEELDPKPGDWAGNLRQRMEALQLPDHYVSLQRLPSHAMHATWTDLVVNHLRYHSDGYELETRQREIDARLLTPVACMVVDAARDYLTTFLGDHAAARPLYERLDDLTARLRTVDRLHEGIMQRDFIAE